MHSFAEAGAETSRALRRADTAGREYDDAVAANMSRSPRAVCARERGTGRPHIDVLSGSTRLRITGLLSDQKRRPQTDRTEFPNATSH